MKNVVYAIATAAMLIVDGAVLAAEPCLQRDMIEGVEGAALRDSHSLVVRDRSGKKYLVSISGWCHGIDIKSATGSVCIKAGDWIATAGDPVKYTFGTLIQSTGTRCFITKVDLYTPEMEAADKAKTEK